MGLVSSEVSLLALQTAVFTLCLHKVLLSVCVCVLVSPSHKAISPFELEPPYDPV